MKAKVAQKKSKFLMGESSDWVMSFDWIFKPINFTKLIEGNYENKEQVNTPAILPQRQQTQVLELTEQEKYEMRKTNGLV